ncbi:hypothetical protein OG946_19075 [Streptomyces sp. NBC_01808]|uniref:hypothetical protein n=1 Tax=Streptomyces sp. NBC_01808 TaxID=2975947 RepID=UPI002DDBD167|nr:hypothetical protein [Streptomyces sp. NBC_01808]WSA39277.1 hypothetical protein OG946_19075 [Streptomyces sp. NBC_01808]
MGHDMAYKRAKPKRYFWIMTIKRFWNEDNGEMSTGWGAIDVHPGETRQELFERIYKRTVEHAEVERAFVAYFSLEPDDLHPREAAAKPGMLEADSRQQASTLRIRIPNRGVERSVLTPPPSGEG